MLSFFLLFEVLVSVTITNVMVIWSLDLGGVHLLLLNRGNFLWKMNIYRVVNYLCFLSTFWIKKIVCLKWAKLVEACITKVKIQTVRQYIHNDSQRSEQHVLIDIVTNKVDPQAHLVLLYLLCHGLKFLCQVITWHFFLYHLQMEVNKRSIFSVDHFLGGYQRKRRKPEDAQVEIIPMESQYEL